MASDRRRHPLFARFYARTSPLMERSVGKYRAMLLDGLSGRVLEVGAGTGANFRHYPGSVESVLAVEPEGHLRRLAGEAAAKADVKIEVVDGVADRLPAGDGSCDAVVVSLVLCSVPDPGTALAEIARVLRPGGELRFFEHVGASGRRLRFQRVADATFWPLISGGCRSSRDTRRSIENAGFTIRELERLGKEQTGMPCPTEPQILGTAVRG